MSSMRWAAIAVSAVVLLAAGCRGAVPVFNVMDAPLTTSKSNPSLDEVGRAIQRAGVALGWQMKQTRPGQMVGTLYLRKHVAVVDVNYSVNSYSIVYKDSTELNYDGGNIHPNYNGWIQNLDKKIRAEVSGI